MVLTFYLWSFSWYVLSFLLFYLLFNIKFWLQFFLSINFINLENYYFYYFSLKVIQQYHIFLKISYIPFILIVVYYLLKGWDSKFFNEGNQINHKLFYWLNLFFYLYIFIGIVWTFMEPSWTNWWMNENIEELILTIIFFYFMSYIHFVQKYYKFWYLAIFYLFCLFYWVEQHNIFFNSRHLKVMFYISFANVVFVIFYKFFFSFFFYFSKKVNYYFMLWGTLKITAWAWNTKFINYIKFTTLNYYSYLFNIIVYFNLLLFILPTFISLWKINFTLDSYYYDLVYLWVINYLSSYSYYKLASFLILVDSILLIFLLNKINLKDYLHIIFFFILLLNSSLIYWDNNLFSNLVTVSNSYMFYTTKGLTLNYYLLKVNFYSIFLILKLKYLQILEYLFVIWFINVFITKNGVRRLSFITILSKKLTVRILW